MRKLQTGEKKEGKKEKKGRGGERRGGEGGEEERERKRKNTNGKAGLNLRQRRGVSQEKGHSPLVRLSGSETLGDV